MAVQQQFWALWRLTVAEAVRQPVFLLLTLANLTATLLTPLLIAHQLGEPAKLARDGALAFHLLFGLLLSSYVAASTLSREIRQGTIATILSRAVSRATLLLAKFAGIVVLLLWFSGCATATSLLAERIAPRFFQPDVFVLRVTLLTVAVALLGAAGLAFRSRRPYTVTAQTLLTAGLVVAGAMAAFFDRDGHPVRLGTSLDWRLLPAHVLVTLALFVAAAWALACATRLQAAPTIAVLVLILFLGLVADHLLAVPATRHPLAALLYGALPNWQHYWMADALAGGGRISWLYVAATVPYTACYTGAVLCVGLLCFRRRQF